MKKIIMSLVLLLMLPPAFADWDNWSAQYNDELGACSMGTANRKTKSSWADSSMTIAQTGKNIVLVVRSDKWMRHDQSDRTEHDIIVNFGKKDGEFRDTFLSTGRGGYLLDITEAFSTFLIAVAQNGSVRFTPIGSPKLPQIAVPLSGKNSKQAIMDFVNCIQGNK